MKPREFIIYHLIPGAFAMCIIAPIAFMALDRDLPYDAQAGEIAPPDPHPGETVQVHWRGVRTRSCVGTVHRTIIDSRGVTYTMIAVDAVYDQPQNAISLTREFALPVQIAPGPAIYKAHTEFVCNPVQRFWPISMDAPPVHFNIAMATPILTPPKVQPKTTKK